jgi:gas vesicle protein
VFLQLISLVPNLKVRACSIFSPEGKDMKRIWIAFGIGAAAGAAVALLYAPQSGVKTRKQLRKGIADAGETLEDAGDYLRSQAEKLSEEAQKLVRRTKGQVEDIADATSSLVAGAVKTAKTLM